MFGVETLITQQEDGSYQTDWCCGDLAHMERAGYVVIDGEWLMLGVEAESRKDFQRFNISFCPVCGAVIRIKRRAT